MPPQLRCSRTHRQEDSGNRPMKAVKSWQYELTRYRGSFAECYLERKVELHLHLIGFRGVAALEAKPSDWCHRFQFPSLQRHEQAFWWNAYSLKADFASEKIDAAML